MRRRVARKILSWPYRASPRPMTVLRAYRREIQWLQRRGHDGAAAFLGAALRRLTSVLARVHMSYLRAGWFAPRR